MTAFLDQEALHKLTGKTRSSAQVRALRGMGITHRVRADGTAVVLESHIEALLGNSAKIKPEPQPDWDALAATQTQR